MIRCKMLEHWNQVEELMLAVEWRRLNFEADFGINRMVGNI